MMTAKMGERDSREEIMKAFRLFDDDETVRSLPAAIVPRGIFPRRARHPPVVAVR